MSRNYKNMIVFQKADVFAKEVYRISAEFPKEELYGITSQLRRAVLSIPLNIVEGSGKSSDRDFLRFLDIALGSSFEVNYLLQFTEDLGFLAGPIADSLKSSNLEIIKILQTFIKRLRTPKTPNPKP